MSDNQRYVTPEKLLESVTRRAAIVIASDVPAKQTPLVMAERIVMTLRTEGIEFVKVERVRSGGMEVYP